MLSWWLNRVTPKKYVGKITKYESVRGRTNQLREYKILKIGDEILTNVEINIGVDRIKDAYERDLTVTLHTLKFRNVLGIMAIESEGVFYCYEDKGIVWEARFKRYRARFILLMLLTCLYLAYQGLVNPDPIGGPLLPLVMLFVAIYPALILLGPLGSYARRVTPVVLKFQSEIDKATRIAQMEGLRVVKIK